MNEKNYIHTPELHNTVAAEKIVPLLINWFDPKTVVDIGCGLGTWLKVFKSKGINEVLGVEKNITDAKLLCIDKSEIIIHDLQEPFNANKKFDLALCIEVAEHLPEQSAETLINTLVKLSDIIIFSAAIPGQGGQNHLNEQWPDYWIEKFHQRNYVAYDEIREKIWTDANIEWWYRQNIFIAMKKNRKSPFNYYKKVLNVVHPELFIKRYNERLDYMREIHELKKKTDKMAMEIAKLYKACNDK